MSRRPPPPFRPFRDEALPCTDLWVLHRDNTVEAFVNLTIAEIRDLLLAGAAVIWPKAQLPGVRPGWYAVLARPELEQDATIVRLLDAIPSTHALVVVTDGIKGVMARAFAPGEPRLALPDFIDRTDALAAEACEMLEREAQR